MRYKILNTIGGFSEEVKPILAQLGEVHYVGAIPQPEFEKIAPAYDIWMVRVGIRITSSLIQQSPKLKTIATATTGLDHINLEGAQKNGIEVLSLRDETEFLNGITSTAELAFGLLLDLARFTPWAFESVKNYQWDLERFKGHSLSGKTLGILGLGRLGSMVARYGDAFGMKIIFTDPFRTINPGEISPAWRKVDFNTLIRESDALSIHVHLAKDTEHLFNTSVFERMKPSAYLINTSRGRVVDQSDLIAALESKKIAGYASDVLQGEATLAETIRNNPFIAYAREHQNCLVVPHTGGFTYESRLATDMFIAEKLARHYGLYPTKK